VCITLYDRDCYSFCVFLGTPPRTLYHTIAISFAYFWEHRREHSITPLLFLLRIFGNTAENTRNTSETVIEFCDFFFGHFSRTRGELCPKTEFLSVGRPIECLVWILNTTFLIKLVTRKGSWVRASSKAWLQASFKLPLRCPRGIYSDVTFPKYNISDQKTPFYTIFSKSFFSLSSTIGKNEYKQ